MQTGLLTPRVSPEDREAIRLQTRRAPCDRECGSPGAPISLAGAQSGHGRGDRAQGANRRQPGCERRGHRGDWQKTEHGPGPVTRREAQWPGVAGKPDARTRGGGQGQSPRAAGHCRVLRLCPEADRQWLRALSRGLMWSGQGSDEPLTTLGGWLASWVQWDPGDRPGKNGVPS